MFFTLWLLPLSLFEIFIHAYGWGPMVHSLTVRLAQSQLSDSALEWIRSLTPWYFDGNLSAMASWPDDMLSLATNRTGYPNWQWSRELHYIDTPDWSCNYQAERDCINDKCVAGAVKNYTKRLATELDEIQQKGSIVFSYAFSW
jgi:hypothetical protein